MCFIMCDVRLASALNDTRTITTRRYHHLVSKNNGKKTRRTRDITLLTLASSLANKRPIIPHIMTNEMQTKTQTTNGSKDRQRKTDFLLLSQPQKDQETSTQLRFLLLVSFGIEEKRNDYRHFIFSFSFWFHQHAARKSLTKLDGGMRCDSGWVDDDGSNRGIFIAEFEGGNHPASARRTDGDHETIFLIGRYVCPPIRCARGAGSMASSHLRLAKKHSST